MNYKIIIYTIGQILKVVAVIMLLPLVVALICGEMSLGVVLAFVIPAVVGLVLGVLLTIKKVEDRTFYAREGFLVVGVSWLIISLLGAFPFFIGTFGNADFADLTFVDWFFESVSGFTTTGASILHTVESGHQIDVMLGGGYKSLLFWRSLTHWIGGMGVLVFILAVVPSSAGASSIHLMQAESTGPTVGKLVSRMSTTARILYVIYAGMTVVEIGLLSIACVFDGQMTFFHALVLSFGTAGTGGFAAVSTSLAGFSVYTQTIVAVFMFLFGINFNLYFFLFIGKIKDFFKSEELYFYVGLLATGILVTSLSVFFTSDGLTFPEALGGSAFTAVSLMTSTGFATVDFTTWSAFSRGVLLFLMFVGACSGSTGGGFKCSRFLLLIKSAFVRVRKVLNPRAVYSIKVDGKKVEDDVVHGVNEYFVIYALIFVFSVLLISIDSGISGNNDLITSFSATLTCLNNIGPGMTTVIGPSGDFFLFAIPTKLLMSLLMLFGRLEIYPILLLFTPKVYSRKV